jgi:hypothetical protein
VNGLLPREAEEADAPCYAYEGDGSTICLLCAGTNPAAISGYPVNDVFTDLSSLGVSLSDVFEGNGLWANVRPDHVELAVLSRAEAWPPHDASDMVLPSSAEEYQASGAHRAQQECRQMRVITRLSIGFAGDTPRFGSAEGGHLRRDLRLRAVLPAAIRGLVFALAARPAFALAARPGFTLAARPGFTLAARPGFALAARPVFALAARLGFALTARLGFALAARFAIPLGPAPRALFARLVVIARIG